jgi:two-component system, NtrC family, sensor kinase
MRGRCWLPLNGDGLSPGSFFPLVLLSGLIPAFARAQPSADGGSPDRGLIVLLLFIVLLITAIVAIGVLGWRRRDMKERIGLLSHRVDALQQQLIEREKLASLGQLTAGIAHEIKNPLNFVTNFADLSRELIEELQGAETVEDRNEILASLRQNLTKISEHGHRADDIVRGMMLHARRGNSEREVVDLNALISESAHLAYHAMRAQQDGFNCTIALELEESVPHPRIVREDIGRVLLNIMQNAMQAVHSREKSGEPGYAPLMTVHSTSMSDRVVVRIRDNGPGIPDEIRDRIFEAFFTTKGADKGTGLGLSIAHDIVVTQHGGAMRVEHPAEGGAEFVIELPVS